MGRGDGGAGERERRGRDRDRRRRLETLAASCASGSRGCGGDTGERCRVLSGGVERNDTLMFSFVAREEKSCLHDQTFDPKLIDLYSHLFHRSTEPGIDSNYDCAFANG